MPLGERAKRETGHLSHAQSRPQRSHRFRTYSVAASLILTLTILVASSPFGSTSWQASVVRQNPTLVTCSKPQKRSEETGCKTPDHIANTSSQYDYVCNIAKHHADKGLTTLCNGTTDHFLNTHDYRTDRRGLWTQEDIETSQMMIPRLEGGLLQTPTAPDCQHTSLCDRSLAMQPPLKASQHRHILPQPNRHSKPGRPPVQPTTYTCTHTNCSSKTCTS